MTSTAHDPSLPPWLRDAQLDDLPKRRSAPIEITGIGKVGRVPFQELATAPVAPPARPATAVDEPSRSPIDNLDLLRRAQRPPGSGWRRVLHKATRGRINPGESRADLAFRALVDRVNQPIRGDYRIAVLSLKGGVGKTTTTVGLGATFASVRGDRVIAVDANPDLGTLGHRAPRQTRSTVRTLLDDPDIRRYSDVRAHTSQAPSRLEVLASEQDPAVSEAFSESDYRAAMDILGSYYNIILTDSGTGLLHSAMAGVLDLADTLVLVTSPAIDGARSASATLDWLEHHGHEDLAARSVVVVNAARGERSDGGVWRGERSDGGVWRGERSDGGVWRGERSDGGVWRGERSDGGVWRGERSDGGVWGERSDGGVWRGERSDGGVWRGERSDGGMWRRDRRASTVDLDQLCRVFAQRTRAVAVVPFDEHLAEGAEIDLDLLAKPTRIALLELAAVVADGFTTG